jgi:hypothetical protein
MKQGRTIIELAKELERQRAVRKDYVADTRSLEFATEKGVSTLSLGMNDGLESFADWTIWNFVE